MAIVHVNATNFEEIKASDKTVLLDFYADWCGPCRMVAPTVEEIAEENEHLTVGKINVDEQMELAIRFKVTSIPLLVVMKDGQVVKQALGARSKDQILALIP